MSCTNEKVEYFVNIDGSLFKAVIDGGYYYVKVVNGERAYSISHDGKTRKELRWLKNDVKEVLKMYTKKTKKEILMICFLHDGGEI